MTDRPEPARRLASDIRLAIASNAIAAAVRERGDWLRLSTRDSAAHAVLAALDRAEEQAAAGGPITLELTAHTEPDVLRCSLAVLGQPHEAGLWEPQPGMPPVRCPGHPAAPGGLREEIEEALWSMDHGQLHQTDVDRGVAAVMAVVEPHLARRAEAALAVNPPGGTGEVLPPEILARITTRQYLSTACDTAQALAAENIDDHAARLHKRCRRNHKFTGALCVCECHNETQEA